MEWKKRLTGEKDPRTSLSEELKRFDDFIQEHEGNLRKAIDHNNIDYIQLFRENIEDTTNIVSDPQATNLDLALTTHNLSTILDICRRRFNPSYGIAKEEFDSLNQKIEEYKEAFKEIHDSYNAKMNRSNRNYLLHDNLKAISLAIAFFGTFVSVVDVCYAKPSDTAENRIATVQFNLLLCLSAMTAYCAYRSFKTALARQRELDYKEGIDR